MALRPTEDGTIRDDPPVANDWALVVRVLGIVGPAIVTIATPTTGVVTSIAASDVPSVFLAANPARLGAIITNDSPDGFLYVKLAAGVLTTSYTVRIGPRGSYEIQFPGYTGVIEGVFSTGASGFAQVTELT